MTTKIPRPSRGARIGLAHHIGGLTPLSAIVIPEVPGVDDE